VTRAAALIIAGAIMAALPAAVIPAAALAQSVSHALLVGVGTYDHPSIPDLQGPPHDVALLRDVLVAQGFAAERVTTLSDGLGLKPTRANILAALDALAARAGPDDFVFVAMGGHGSRQPDPDGEADELDGLDEIFLPADTGDWDPRGGSALNAIVDDELAARLAAILETGAFVWLVVDSCHSETASRGIEAARYVAPGDLGIPIPAQRGAASAVSEGTRLDPVAAGNFVGFYAAQADQLTYDKLLPAEGGDRDVHGIFSFHVAQVLATAPDVSFTQAIDAVHLAYRELNHHRSTPIIEGRPAALARAIGGGNAAEVEQYAFTRENGELRLRAGRLHRIGEETLLALARTPTFAADAVVAYARPRQIKTLDAMLKTVSHDGLAPPSVLPDSGYARVVDRPLPLRLTVAPPASWPELEADAPMLARALEAADDDAIRWVDFDATAQLRLQIADGRLWLLPSSGAGADDATPSLPLPDASTDLAAWAGRFRGEIERQAAAVQLYALAREFFHDRATSSVETRFSVNDALAANGVCVEEGDRVGLEIVNHGTAPLDVTVLFVDAEQCIHPWFPAPGASNRLPAGETLRGIAGRIEATTVGREGWVVLGLAGEPNRRRADFSFLAGNCDGTRSLRFDRAGSGSGLQTMIGRAIRGENESQRGLAPAGSVQGGFAQIIEWKVRGLRARPQGRAPTVQQSLQPSPRGD